MKLLKATLAALIATTTFNVSADVIGNQRIKGLVVTAGASTAYITVNSTDGKCTGFNRIEFNKNDKELYAFILTLYTTQKAVAIQFNPNGTSLGGVPGHGSSPCELQSIWTEGA